MEISGWLQIKIEMSSFEMFNVWQIYVRNNLLGSMKIFYTFGKKPNCHQNGDTIAKFNSMNVNWGFNQFHPLEETDSYYAGEEGSKQARQLLVECIA